MELNDTLQTLRYLWYTGMTICAAHTAYLIYAMIQLVANHYEVPSMDDAAAVQDYKKSWGVFKHLYPRYLSAMRHPSWFYTSNSAAVLCISLWGPMIGMHYLWVMFSLTLYMFYTCVRIGWASIYHSVVVLGHAPSLVKEYFIPGVDLPKPTQLEWSVAERLAAEGSGTELDASHRWSS
jgi:hypothetical protein